jgi:purine-cytosine permease-like protein
MMMDPAFLSAIALIVGAGLTWFIYGSSLREYHRQGDSHAVDVTLLAMFGTFMPTLMVMALPWI